MQGQAGGGPHAAHRRAPTGVGPLVKVNDAHARARKKSERNARTDEKNVVEGRVATEDPGDSWHF